MKHLFKSTRSSRTRCKIDNLFTYKKTIIKMLISNELRCRYRTRICDLQVMNLASYQLLQPAMCAAYLHRRAAFKLLNKLKTPLEARAQRRTSCDDKIGIILLSPCISYTTSLFVFIMNEQFSLHLDFRSSPCSPDCNIFTSACIDNSSFRCSPSVYFMQY